MAKTSTPLKSPTEVVFLDMVCKNFQRKEQIDTRCTFSIRNFRSLKAQFVHILQSCASILLQEPFHDKARAGRTKAATYFTASRHLSGRKDT